MSARRLAVVLIAFLVLPMTGFSPAADGQGSGPGSGASSTVTFYGHVFGHGLGGPMPANTEAPIGEDNYGIGSSFGFCDSPTPVFEDCTETGFNKLVLFSTAGFVDVDNRAEFLQEGGYALLHNERGQTKDILLDTSGSIEATVFFTMDMHGWLVGNGYGTNCIYPHPEDVPCLYPSWGWDPGVAQDVKVDAALYTAKLGEVGANASDPPPIEDALASGDAQVIAEGSWGPDLVMNGLPGSPNANEFTIDLGAPTVDTVPRDQDFFLVYTVYQESGGQNYQIDSGLRWWGGEFFPPSFKLPVENAFDVERVIPTFAHGKMAILGVMNTPWGSYDIDPESVDLSIEGPRGEIAPEHISRFGKFSVAHGGHYLPINITWIWDYRQEGLAPGPYEITLSAQNFQGSAAGSCTASFVLQEDARGQLAPGSIEEGVCGLQSVDEAFVQGIRQGAEGNGS